MLKSLNIENIAIIEKASVEFSEGLNILTGETGAGKSIIIDSINAVSGEKTSRELIRTGESSACVTALFQNISPLIKEKLSENALPSEGDDTLLLQRKITRDGKNICRINGCPATVSMLKSFGINLINIHGQRDSQALLNPEHHLGFLDDFGKNEELLNDYRESFYRLTELKNEIKSLKMDEEEKIRRTDILSFQIKELSEAGIIAGERQELHKKKNILSNTMKLISSLRNSLILLNGDGENSGASGLISEASSEINSAAALAKGMDALTESLEEALSSVEDSAGMIEDVLSQLENIDGNPEEIDERLDLLYRLSRKYGETEEEMLEFLENAKAEYDKINCSEEQIHILEEEYDKLYPETVKKAEKLSEKRNACQSLMCSLIKNELTYLDMPSCRFIVDMKKIPLCENGIDSAEFLISANAGEEPKPLVKVASGGELSRIMLALKNVLNSEDSIGTLIFDEIDTGVSGSAARKIAEKLSEVSKNTQVLCITHLAQIAAFADEHKYICKKVSEGKTYTEIKTLRDEERPGELARMSFGGEITKVHLDSAKQMIESARETKEG